MYVCMYVRMYVCMYVYIHTYMHTYIHTYIHIYRHFRYICIHIHIHIHTHTHTYIHTYMHAYIHTYINTYKQAKIQNIQNIWFYIRRYSKVMWKTPILLNLWYFTRATDNIKFDPSVRNVFSLPWNQKATCTGTLGKYFSTSIFDWKCWVKYRHRLLQHVFHHFPYDHCRKLGLLYVWTHQISIVILSSWSIGYSKSHICWFKPNFSPFLKLQSTQARHDMSWHVFVACGLRLKPFQEANFRSYLPENCLRGRLEIFIGAANQPPRRPEHRGNWYRSRYQHWIDFLIGKPAKGIHGHHPQLGVTFKSGPTGMMIRRSKNAPPFCSVWNMILCMYCTLEHGYHFDVKLSYLYWAVFASWNRF